MGKWNEGMPKLVCHGVLVWVENDDGIGSYAIAYLDEKHNWIEWMTDKPIEDFKVKVVAWQELPDEYKGAR